MAQWHVTINGAVTIEDDDGEKTIFEEEYNFMWTGIDFITVMMAVQQRVDCLNELKKKCFLDGPEKGHRKAWFGDGDEFKIVGITETDLIQFTHEWMNEYANNGIVNHEEA